MLFRQIIVAKSPVSPVVAFPYYITDQGIKMVQRRPEPGVEAVDELDSFIIDVFSWNYWDRQINV